MMGFLKNILGGSDVVDKGMKMLDDAFYTDAEKAEDKAKLIQQKSEHKINLLKAYAPFKVAQRYIAIVFLFCFAVSYFAILVLTAMDHDTKKYLDVIEAFHIQYIMMIIVGFYFGGGLAESMSRGKSKINRSLIDASQKGK